MKQTKLFYPKYYEPLYNDRVDRKLNFGKMRKANYPESVLKWFEKNNYGYGFTESIDKTINRWIFENKDRLEIIDIKYQGVADENNNVSVLIIYEEKTND